MKLLLCMGLVGCAGGSTCGQGDTRVGVIDDLLFARADAGVSVGFDLDGQVSTEDGPTGCGIADYTAPNGTVGVDNALARLIPALELTEAIAAEGILHDTINSGELLLMFEMSGIDDLEDDTCVNLDVARGAGRPLLGADGSLISGQTFDRDPEVADVRVDDAVVVDGVVVGRGFDLRVPLRIFDAELDLVLEGSGVHIVWAEDGSTFTGYLGGAVDYWAIVDVALDSNVDQSLAASLPVLFGHNADMDPDDAGTCQKISLTFEFSGVSAFFFEEP